ncbi:MAG: glutamate--tRNA ligase [Bacteroidota bacterium]
MAEKVRVRFAPSPTGPLHIGGVRTALFNYLFAKKHKGTFVLRIEDTDQNRYVPGTEAYIKEALLWCGIPYDEGPDTPFTYGPYRQSERKTIYQKYVQILLDSGHAYYAFDTPETLDFHRKDHEAKGKTFIYNWHNRLKLTNSLSLSPQQVQEKLAAKEDYVIRFKSPMNTTLILKDAIRGEITNESALLDDKILFKSDGMPTYHLANVVDDHLMEISHVIRGEEWLPSLALHHLLYDAFGWKKPVFAHLPLILKPTGKGKLSKRDSEKGGFPIFPLTWNTAKGYREAGYFPEAVINFLAFLGWNPGTEQEVFSLADLVETFSLERVHKSGARFDPEKTKWYNHKWLQQQPNSTLIPYLKEKDLPKPLSDDAYLERVISLIKERANFPQELWGLGDYFFHPPKTYLEKAVQKHWKEDTPEIIHHVSLQLKEINDFSSTILATTIKSWIQKASLSFGKVMPPLRLVIVGELKGPDLFAIMETLGKKECISRITTALDTLPK